MTDHNEIDIDDRLRRLEETIDAGDGAAALRAELKALRADMAAVQRKIDPPAPRPEIAGMPQGADVLFDNSVVVGGKRVGTVGKDADGRKVFISHTGTHEEYLAALQLRIDSDAADRERYRTEGLPPGSGLWRDSSGIIRHGKEGKLAVIEREPVTAWIEVRLQRDWFVDGTRYPKNKVIAIPAHLAPKLPSTAKLIGACDAPERPETDADKVRAINRELRDSQRDRAAESATYGSKEKAEKK